MILPSLVSYYEALEKNQKITSPGWCMAKVSYALQLSEQGELIGILPLKREEVRGKKTVLLPMMCKVPQMVSRSSGVSANFLCDNSSYFLGVDNKGNLKRTKECFACAAQKHQEILAQDESKAAKAILYFFEKWNPDEAEKCPILKDELEEIKAGANLIFCVDGKYVQEEESIMEAWESYRKQDSDSQQGICLVTGKKSEIARIHGSIKGVRDAQSSGALLVSFNAPAFESYGKEQSYNAPISTYAVYAYTTALNYLLSDASHCTLIGDTTIVYWSEDGEEVYQNVFAQVCEPTKDNQEIVDGVFKNLRDGKAISVEDIEKNINLEQKFYILGLAPNAARLAVRFFYQDSFGNILNNLKTHYDRMEIVRPAADSMEYMGMERMLFETVNKKAKDKKPIPNMAAEVYRAILSGNRYPESLYQSVLRRIFAEQDNSDTRIYKITRGRAAIIKAYLLKNKMCGEEEITVGINEENSNVAYVLGRVFSVLEVLQEAASNGINATIKDKYFNAACATPASIFPILFKLANNHMRKLPIGLKITYEKQLGMLQEKISFEQGQTLAYPKRLSLEQQGMFILGYYHQTQKRYEKKIKGEQ